MEDRIQNYKDAISNVIIELVDTPSDNDVQQTHLAKKFANFIERLIDEKIGQQTGVYYRSLPDPPKGKYDDHLLREAEYKSQGKISPETAAAVKESFREKLKAAVEARLDPPIKWCNHYDDGWLKNPNGEFQKAWSFIKFCPFCGATRPKGI